MSTRTHGQTKPEFDGNLGGQARESIDAATESVRNRWLSLGGETRRTVNAARCNDAPSQDIKRRLADGGSE